MAKSIQLYAARGTGEPYGANMLSNVTRLLDRDVFTIREIVYPAAISGAGGLESWQESAATFRAFMDRELSAKRPWMGVGYSLGALCLGDLVGTLPLSQCKGIGLLADPRRHRTQYYGSRKPSGWGIAGERFVGRGDYPVWSLTEPGDPISELPGDNGWRNVAMLLGFGKQPRPARDWDMAYSFEWLSHYPPLGNRHTNYHREVFPGTRKKYTEVMADLLNEQGRKIIKEL